jgi:hypothetical protein
VTRHTFASACLSDGLNPAKVAALLGDTLEVTLDTYAHFLPDDDDRAREILGSFFRPADRPSAQNVPAGALSSIPAGRVACRALHRLLPLHWP